MIRILAFDDFKDRTHQGKGLIMQLRCNDVDDTRGRILGNTPHGSLLIMPN